MKLSEYIKHLRDLQKKHGNVDVMINNMYECADCSIYEKCIVIEDNYISYD